MKRIFIALCILTSSTAKCQLNHVGILLSLKDNIVRDYLDSLNSLHPNSYFKIATDYNKEGDLVLIADFAIKDQPFFTCTAIICVFQRINGVELCVRQIVMGDAEYATRNINYVKDNFKEVKTGEWEKPFPGDNKLKIGVLFKTELVGSKNGYTIIYNLDPVN